MATASVEREELLNYENDILSGILKAAEYAKDNTRTIKIRRGGQTLFQFRIHPLSEEEYFQCSKSATKYKHNRRLGIQIAEETDRDLFRSALIFQATVKEDQDKIWRNSQAWRSLDVIRPEDMISKVLMAGEKDRICDIIDEISGYGSMDEERPDPEEQLKN